CLYHLREFRREVFQWNRFNPKWPRAADVMMDPSLAKNVMIDDGSLLGALQYTFAYMYLYPLVISYERLKRRPDKDFIDPLKWYIEQLEPPEKTPDSLYDFFQPHPALSMDLDMNLCTNFLAFPRFPNGLMGGLHSPPSVKKILKALNLHDVQKMEIPDPLAKVHGELFATLVKELAKSTIDLKMKRWTTVNISREEEELLEKADQDQSNFESVCQALFSSSDCSMGLFDAETAADISTGFLRCKHVHSLQKALESRQIEPERVLTTMSKYPEVLFIYLSVVKNSKKGELFDIPIRLDCTNLLEPKTSHEKDRFFGVSMAEREKQRRRLRRKELDDTEEEDATDSKEKSNDTTNEKWYSLLALILREGDPRGDGCGAQTSHYLLIRPLEEGPWFRVGDDRVERLHPK
ncbi:hypothetical protein IE077_003105, partial [Cardiosporidium cionae]